MSVLQRPAYLANRTQSTLASTLSGGLGVAQPPRISLKDDRFTLLMPNGDRHPAVAPSLTIDVIVVGGNPTASRIYYDASYDAADAAAPVCWSDNGVGPSVSAGTPQSATCADCPQAVWGAKISSQGSKIPACSTVKKVAVLVAGAGETVFLLQIPPGSLKPWRGFLAHLDTLGAAIDEVIVRLSMTDKTLAFEPVDFLPQAVYEFAQKIMAGPEPDAVVGVKDKAREGFLPGPAAQPALGFVTQTQADANTARTLSIQVPPLFTQQPAVEVESPAEREAREFAEFKAAKAAQAGPIVGVIAAAAPQFGAAPEPAKRTRARKGETVVGPGPIAAGTFAAPQAGGFIGGGSPPPSTPAGFGMAPPANAAQGVADAIAKAFNLPT